MKTLLFRFGIVLSVCASLTISGCKKEDTSTKACIQTSGTTFETNETISFSSCSQNANTFLWNFDDGETSDEKNPTHAYGESGTYDVTLTVDGAGGSSTITKSITVEHTADNYVGSYSTSEVCTGGNDNYTSTVTKISSTSIAINNFYGSGWTVTGTIDGNAVTIANQTIPNSNGVNVSGSGTLNSTATLMILNYTISDGTNSLSCAVSYNKQ